MPDICTCFTGMPKNITFAGDFKNDIWGEYSLDSDAEERYRCSERTLFNVGGFSFGCGHVL